MGDSKKPRFYELDHEPKMLLLNTHSHTFKRPDYEASKTRRKAIEGNEDPTIRRTNHEKPAVYRQSGGRARGKRHHGKTNHRGRRYGKANHPFLQVLPTTPFVTLLGQSGRHMHEYTVCACLAACLIKHL